MNGLVLYERMCCAITACACVDEAKDIRDKALALEAYYRQARNFEAEREAANIRIRAERRSGELLKELARAEPADAGKAGRDKQLGLSPAETGPASPFAEALEANGISRQQASKFQALAEIPEQEFEEALAAPAKPTTSGVLSQVRQRVNDPAPPPPTRVTTEAMLLWKYLRELEGISLVPPADLFAGMTPQVAKSVRDLAPLVAEFLSQLKEPANAGA